jgi:hypothetical protein
MARCSISRGCNFFQLFWKLEKHYKHFGEKDMPNTVLKNSIEEVIQFLTAYLA